MGITGIKITQVGKGWLKIQLISKNIYCNKYIEFILVEELRTPYPW